MSEAEEKSAEISDTIEDRYAELARQARLLRLGLIVITLTVATFLYVQNRRLGGDVQKVRVQLAQLVDASKKDQANINLFASKLFEYGQSHPDFAQLVLVKYGIKPGGNPVAPGASPVPTVPANTAAPVIAPKK